MLSLRYRLHVISDHSVEPDPSLLKPVSHCRQLLAQVL